MFTGIIETIGVVENIRKDGSDLRFEFRSSISDGLSEGQSVSHDGVCLTVERAGKGTHQVTVVEESLKRSTLERLAVGSPVNLERSMPASGRFEGHIVQGHVDQRGQVKSIKDENGSHVFEIAYDPGLNQVTVEKGSICVNGVSLTCFGSRVGSFFVAVIPYTYQHTNFKLLGAGDWVNLEFDIIGKYVERMIRNR